MSTGISVKDAMVTRVVVGRPDQSVKEGADMMRKEDVGTIVVCEGTKPIGIVTREDIVVKIASKDLKSSTVKLKDIMNAPLITATPEEDLADAARRMTKYGYERLPVVEMDKLVGIISDREIAKVAPAAIEILRERLMIDDENIPEHDRETDVTEGDCELCGNYSEELHNVNDRWVCDACAEEAEEL